MVSAKNMFIISSCRGQPGDTVLVSDADYNLGLKFWNDCKPGDLVLGVVKWDCYDPYENRNETILSERVAP